MSHVCVLDHVGCAPAEHWRQLASWTMYISSVMISSATVDLPPHVLSGSNYLGGGSGDGGGHGGRGRQRRKGMEQGTEHIHTHGKRTPSPPRAQRALAQAASSTVESRRPTPEQQSGRVAEWPGNCHSPPSGLKPGRVVLKADRPRRVMPGRFVRGLQNRRQPC